MSARRRTVQTVIVLLDSALFAHFAFGLWLTTRVYVWVGDWSGFGWFILPYVGLTGVFVLSAFLAIRHLRWAVGSLIVAVVLSALMCAYDLVNHRCQMLGGGIGHVYTMWWWYYEPFWYDYTPGNV